MAPLTGWTTPEALRYGMRYQEISPFCLHIHALTNGIKQAFAFSAVDGLRFTDPGAVEGWVDLEDQYCTCKFSWQANLVSIQRQMQYALSAPYNNVFIVHEALICVTECRRRQDLSA